MATLLIPTVVDAAHWTQKARLDGRDYLLRFTYNQRVDRYFLSIHDEDDAALLSGIRVVTNWSFLRHYRWNTALPPGTLAAVTLTQDFSPPGFGELGEGRRVELTYFEAETTT